MRKTEIYVVTKNNRDKDKRFLITEMSALRAERWATRALLALTKSGQDIGSVRTGGMAALAMAALQGLQYLQFDDADPLMMELMDCVRIIPDPKHPETSRPLIQNDAEGDDIEEVETRIILKDRIFRLHTDFFTRADP
jgi:hypothetical protein